MMGAADRLATSMPTEEALARQFAERHSGDLRYVDKWGAWLCWDGMRWCQDETRIAFDYARALRGCVGAQDARPQDSQRRDHRGSGAHRQGPPMDRSHNRRMGLRCSIRPTALGIYDAVTCENT
jgi:hypothetical protein